MRPSWSLLLLAGPALAQAPDSGLAAFRQACLDATTDGVALNVAAHPDDEAGSSQVVLRRKYGLRTVNLYSTYGDGGQNAIGREIGPELAAIRVRETLAAADHYGNRVRWLGFEDFGFSKTMEETLEKWGREVLLQRMRTQIAQIDPDIVITNHTTTGGHGHHRSSAFALETILRERAETTGQVVALFQPGGGRGARGGRGQRAAGNRGAARNDGGDRGARRGAGRRGRAADAEAERPQTVVLLRLDAGELDPVRGTTFSRQALEGLSEHRSQGMGGTYTPLRRGRGGSWRLAFPEPAPPESGTRTLEADVMEFVGSVLAEEAFQRTWRSLGQDLQTLEMELAAFAEDRAVAEHVGRARRLLPMLRRAADELPPTEAGARAGRRLARRIDALERVVLTGSGVSVEAVVARPQVPFGGDGEILLAVHSTGGVEPTDVEARSGDRIGVPVDGTAGVFRVPFTSERPAGDAMGDGLNREPAWVTAEASFELDGLPFVVRRTVAYEPVPPIQLKWDRDLSMVPAGTDVERIFSMAIRYHGDDVLQERVRFEAPAGVVAEAIPAEVDLSRERPEVAILVRIRVREGSGLEPKLVYAGLGDRDSVLTLQPVAVEIDPALRVGLVSGPDDTLQHGLEDLGIAHNVLDVSRLALTDLSRFSTLVLDFRSYATQPALAEHADRILRFCRAGGRVVVFYHKTGEWNPRPGRPFLAPFPFRVSGNRVTEEDAAVTMLEPEHRIWNHPHAIVPEDFNGWVQERGLYFAGEWDDAWTPLMSMRDQGSEPLEGALLYTDYGKGEYVYCALSIYRQLRRGHQGATRILLNLLTR